ncbi:MAG TPA: glycosyltransferase family 39 protein [Candidatus Acidoferrales bacterium]|nr:glycosyltransferase family 39 protein [Candidatus Acidoferrales bacterium]
MSRAKWALIAILTLGLALRLYGLHSPVLDHPGWRQGDTAAIARNFATLNFNILYPQVDYDGPPPNYVELELQIVPFLAAAGYKIFGVHEVFGRLISIAFSLGTVAVLYWFGRLLFASTAIGLGAALAFAIFPGSVYYGRTFTPDTTMTFFLTAALYASARWILEAGIGSWRAWWPAAALTLLAILAKPVAALALVPVAVLLYRREGRAAFTRVQAWAFFVVAIVPYLAYDRFVSAQAEWKWASGITALHVIPSFLHSLVSLSGLASKMKYFLGAFDMLAHTMLGPVGFALALLGTLVLVATRPAGGADRRALVADYVLAWLIAGLAYAYVVVTVERVDYYLYPLVPVAALLSAYAVVELAGRVAPLPSRAVAAAAIAALILTLAVNELQIAPYYAYSKLNYRSARLLDRTLPPGAIVVMAHYDPSILYYINRKGWEEDPLLWTPFDEESAIKKGSRYFIAVENARFKHNAELYAWMQRFPVEGAQSLWPVYHTDPSMTVRNNP